MTDLARLQPGDVIRHRQYPEHAARVVYVGARIEAVMVEHPEPNWNDRPVRALAQPYADHPDFDPAWLLALGGRLA